MRVEVEALGFRCLFRGGGGGGSEGRGVEGTRAQPLTVRP